MDRTPGDGVGGTESYVGDASDVQECTALVQSTQPRANGATYPAAGGSTRCYAEFGMAGADNSTAWQTCRFPGALSEQDGICLCLGRGRGSDALCLGRTGLAQNRAGAAAVRAAAMVGRVDTHVGRGGAAAYAAAGLGQPLGQSLRRRRRDVRGRGPAVRRGAVAAAVPPRAARARGDVVRLARRGVAPLRHLHRLGVHRAPLQLRPALGAGGPI